MVGYPIGSDGQLVVQDGIVYSDTEAYTIVDGEVPFNAKDEFAIKGSAYPGMSGGANRPVEYTTQSRECSS